MIRISEQTELSDEIIDAVTRLLPQLSPTARIPTVQHINEILAAEGTRLFCARDADKRIIGFLVLVIFRIPTGLRFRIEDVVVDEAARGSGTGKQLLLTALEAAGKMGAKQVDLSCRPARKSANRLYQKLGFEKRDTNVYRYYLKNK
jgi:ribosomal protein S18 acetylase RimI-like enzyme